MFHTDSVRRLSAVDLPYTFGRPVSTYVDLHTEARLTVLRARIAATVPIGRRELGARTVEALATATVHGRTYGAQPLPHWQEPTM